MSWDERWAAAGAPGDPFPWVVRSVAAHAPKPPARSLDIAGGNGRHAVWLAGQGYDSTDVDVSEVGLGLARQAAEQAGTTIHTVVRDIEADGLPPGAWDLVVMIRYFHRPVLRSALTALAPGGVLLFAQPTERNLERHDRPARAFLPGDGEIADLLGEWAIPDVEIVALDEGWRDNDCHEVRLVARNATA